MSPFSTNLLRIPGLTSTTLSLDATTLIATSPAPASFFFRKLFTRVSIYVPSFVTGNRLALNLFSLRFCPFFFKQLSQVNLCERRIIFLNNICEIFYNFFRIKIINKISLSIFFQKEIEIFYYRYLP